MHTHIPCVILMISLQDGQTTLTLQLCSAKHHASVAAACPLDTCRDHGTWKQLHVHCSTCKQLQ